MPLLPQAIAFSQTKRCLQVYSDLHSLHSLFRSTSGREGWKFSKAWGGGNKKHLTFLRPQIPLHRSHALEGHPIDSETWTTSVVKLASQSSSSQGYKHEQAVLVDWRKVAAFRQPKWVPAKPGKDWWGTMSHVHVLKTKNSQFSAFANVLGRLGIEAIGSIPAICPKLCISRDFSAKEINWRDVRRRTNKTNTANKVE